MGNLDTGNKKANNVVNVFKAFASSHRNHKDVSLRQILLRRQVKLARVIEKAFAGTFLLFSHVSADMFTAAYNRVVRQFLKLAQ